MDHAVPRSHSSLNKILEIFLYKLLARESEETPKAMEAVAIALAPPPTPQLNNKTLLSMTSHR